MALRAPNGNSDSSLISAATFNTTACTLIVKVKRRTAFSAEGIPITLEKSNQSVLHALRIMPNGTIQGCYSWFTSVAVFASATVGQWDAYYIVGDTNGSGTPIIRFGVVINGVAAETTLQATGGDPSYTGTDYRWRIGSFANPPSYLYPSECDFASAHAFTRALTQAELVAEASTQAPASSAGLHSYLSLVGKTTSTAPLDESGNGNNWTTVGAALTVDDSANPTYGTGGGTGGGLQSISITSFTVDPDGQTTRLRGTYSGSGTVTASERNTADNTTVAMTVTAAGGNGGTGLVLPGQEYPRESTQAGLLYGSGKQRVIDSLFNLDIKRSGGLDRSAWIRYKSIRNSAIVKARWYWSDGSGYMGGDGGVIRTRIYPADGSGYANMGASHFGESTRTPAALGVSAQTYTTPSNRASLDTFSSTSALTSGQHYLFVGENIAADPATNWSSWDMSWTYSGNGRGLHYTSNFDWSCGYGSRAQGTSGAYTWDDRTMNLYSTSGETGYFSPIMEVEYADGTVDGDWSIESGNVVGREWLETSAGQAKRELFAALAAAESFVGFSMAVGCTVAGTLNWALKDGAGATVESGSITKSAANVTTTTGGFGYVGYIIPWEQIAFAQQRAFAAGATFSVEFTVSSGTWLFVSQQVQGSLPGRYPAAWTKSVSQTLISGTWRDTDRYNHSATGANTETFRISMHRAGLGGAGTFEATAQTGPGTFAGKATLTDGATVNTADAANTVNIATVTGVGLMATTFPVTAINMSAPPAMKVGDTWTPAITDQAGYEVAGAVMSSSSTAATVSTPTNVDGHATVSAVGSGSVTITAALGALTASRTIDIAAVTPPQDQLPVIVATLPNGTVGVAYAATVTATGPGAVTLTAAGLPAGLTMSSGGAITGTPTVSGGFLLAVTATNVAPLTGRTTVLYNLHIDPTAALAGASAWASKIMGR